jgi:hypothetical protein
MELVIRAELKGHELSWMLTVEAPADGWDHASVHQADEIAVAVLRKDDPASLEPSAVSTRMVGPDRIYVRAAVNGDGWHRIIQ